MEWNATKEELQKIEQIVERAGKIYYKGQTLSFIRGTIAHQVVMDLDAVHSNGCPLDFDKLLAFDDFNFYHDIVGIAKHLDRDTGKLKNCFRPRCAR